MGEPVAAEVEQTLVFVVKVRSFGHGDERHRLSVTATLGRHLNRAFGPERYELWHDGQRLIFDPLAQDGEHEGHRSVVVADTPPLVS